MNTTFVCERTTTATTATTKVKPTTIHGNTFASALRPSPKAVRRLCVYSDSAAYRRPSRGPVYRWYPRSWMTPAGAGSTGGIEYLLVGEQLGDPVPALVQPVQRQVQRGDRTEDEVVGLFGLQRDEQHPPLQADREPHPAQLEGQLVGALVDLDGQHVTLYRHRRRPGQAADPGQVRDELRRDQVGRQAVVLRHVPDPGAHRAAVAHRIHPQDTHLAGGGRDQPEQDLDERGLAGAVRAHQPDDAGLDVDGERVEGAHPRVPLGQPLDLDECHAPTVRTGVPSRMRCAPDYRPLRGGAHPALE